MSHDIEEMAVEEEDDEDEEITKKLKFYKEDLEIYECKEDKIM